MGLEFLQSTQNWLLIGVSLLGFIGIVFAFIKTGPMLVHFPMKSTTPKLEVSQTPLGLVALGYDFPPKTPVILRLWYPIGRCLDTEQQTDERGRFGGTIKLDPGEYYVQAICKGQETELVHQVIWSKEFVLENAVRWQRYSG